MMLDTSNIGIAVGSSLLSCIQIEIYEIPIRFEDTGGAAFAAPTVNVRQIGPLLDGYIFTTVIPADLQDRSRLLEIQRAKLSMGLACSTVHAGKFNITS